MRLGRVDLNLFVVFDALYRERSVTKAASSLNLTQSAISSALGRLRQTFDDPLFVRTLEGMSPTPLADKVVGDVRKGLLLLGNTVGANTRFDPAASEKTFRLGMNAAAESMLLPKVYKRIQKLSPSLQLEASYGSRERATEDLKSGLIDLLIDTPAVGSRDLYQETILETGYVIGMRKTHPLAKKKLNLKEYLSAEHIHVWTGKEGPGLVDFALRDLGHKRNVVIKAQNSLVAARITGMTNLLWSAPLSLIDGLPLHFTDLPFKTESLKWNMYWRRVANGDLANIWLRERVRVVAAEIVSEEA